MRGCEREGEREREREREREGERCLGRSGLLPPQPPIFANPSIIMSSHSTPYCSSAVMHIDRKSVV